MAKHSTKLSLNVQGEGEPLVLLHGWGLNQAIWFPIREQLKQNFQVITVDLPGFGESSWCPGDENFQHTAARIMAELAQVIQAPFHLVGWSMGGLIAMQMALDSPTYIKRLTTVASSPCFVERKAEKQVEGKNVQGEYWPGIKEETLAAFRYQLTTDFRKTLERFLAVQALGSPAAREEIKTMRNLLAERPEPHPEALTAGLRWLAEVDIRSQLKSLSVPLMRIYGRRDSLVPMATNEAVAQYLPANSTGTALTQSVVFGASAHAPFFTEPEQFTDALYRWHLGQ